MHLEILSQPERAEIWQVVDGKPSQIIGRTPFEDTIEISSSRGTGNRGVRLQSQHGGDRLLSDTYDSYRKSRTIRIEYVLKKEGYTSVTESHSELEYAPRGMLQSWGDAQESAYQLLSRRGVSKDHLLSTEGSGWAATPSHQSYPLNQAEFQGHPHRNATLAILTFDPRSGVSSREVALLSDRFEVELGQCKVYKLISRSKMKELLELQQYSINQANAQSAVEAGRLLGVQFMLYGSVGKANSLLTINVYIVNVEEGVIVASAALDYPGALDGFLVKATPQVIRRLLHAVDEHKKEAPR